MDDVLGSLPTSSTFDGSDIVEPCTSSAEITMQQVIPTHQAAKTNGEVHVTEHKAAADNAMPPDAESSTSTESDDGDNTSESGSTTSGDNNQAADETEVARNAQTAHCPPLVK